MPVELTCMHFKQNKSVRWEQSKASQTYGKRIKEESHNY